MEWIEVTAKTVEEAKDAALDQLGVDESDAEFEVVEAQKGGLFGRLRSEARVRARVLPTTPRPKLDRRERRRSGSRTGGSGGGASSAGGGGRAGRRPSRSGGPSERGVQGPSGPSERGVPGPSGPSERGVPGPSGPSERGVPGPARRSATKSPRRESGGTVTDEAAAASRDDVATEFLSGLLEAFGVTYTIERRHLEEDITELAVQGEGLGLLIGPRGQTLSAVQELTRTVVQRNIVAPHGRIVVDVAGYRQARRAALETFTRAAAEEVRASGVPRVLEAMPPADRKVVHDTVNTIPGVMTLSEGEEPSRRVLISPESADHDLEGSVARSTEETTPS